MDKIKDLKEQVANGALDRPSLIKRLRKVRMAAIDDQDAEALKVFDDPVEVVADKMIAEIKKA